jgi:hypothetical protein
MIISWWVLHFGITLRRAVCWLWIMKMAGQQEEDNTILYEKVALQVVGAIHRPSFAVIIIIIISQRVPCSSLSLLPVVVPTGRLEDCYF